MRVGGTTPYFALRCSVVYRLYEREASPVAVRLSLNSDDVLLALCDLDDDFVELDVASFDDKPPRRAYAAGGAVSRRSTLSTICGARSRTVLAGLSKLFAMLGAPSWIRYGLDRTC